MDPVILSRLQFASTTIYHFFFVPLTLGLSWIVALLHTQYYRTGDEKFKRLAKFWGKLFLINFAMGVVTGIVQEFQFGMNWSEYSRFVGDIFGAPLAIEALMAFFMESTFLGIWIFGWDRAPKGLHLASIWLVSIGSNLSALWILLANGFMQHPVGYDPASVATGRLVLNDFFALITNPKGWIFFWHTIAAGLTTAGFFVLGISAWHLIRDKEDELFKYSFQLGAIVAMVFTIVTGLGGHEQGKYVMETQPMKMASIEALWNTEKPASFSLITIGDLSGKHLVWQIRIPKLLSLIACNNLTCGVEGVNQVQADYVKKYGPGDYIPLMVVTYWAFRFMFGASLIMVAVGAYALYLMLKNWPQKWMRWIKWLPWAIALPYIANTSGWILTEMGRQPWIVQGLLKTEQGVTPTNTPGMVLFTLLGFVVLYAILMAADVYLLTRFAKAGPDATDAGVIGDPSLFGEQS
jgi:cytochrome d ubiquinol oxidase subunit I